jgi:hypothetical protein
VELGDRADYKSALQRAGRTVNTYCWSGSGGSAPPPASLARTEHHSPEPPQHPRRVTLPHPAAVFVQRHVQRMIPNGAVQPQEGTKDPAHRSRNQNGAAACSRRCAAARPKPTASRRAMPFGKSSRLGKIRKYRSTRLFPDWRWEKVASPPRKWRACTGAARGPTSITQRIQGGRGLGFSGFRTCLRFRPESVGYFLGWAVREWPLALASPPGSPARESRAVCRGAPA